VTPDTTHAAAITVDDFLDANPGLQRYQYEPKGVRVLERDDNPLGYAWTYYPPNSKLRKPGQWYSPWHEWRVGLRWPEWVWVHDVPSNIRSAEHARPEKGLTPAEVIRPDINVKE
jgi:hypothetical protein